MNTKIRQELTQAMLAQGVCDIGFAQTDDFIPNMNHALSIVVVLSDAVINEIDTAPTHSYFHHYRTVNTFIDQCLLKAGMLLQRHGYQYLPVAASQSINNGVNSFSGRYSHKKIACLAGLGAIGKSDLFIHKQYGPRVRLGTLFTDCDLGGLACNPPSPCGSCNRCVTACPALAISGREFHPQDPQAPLLDAQACSRYMKDNFQHIGRGAVCGICVKVCPLFSKYK